MTTTTTPLLNQSSSIARTAFDSIQAKQSATVAGHNNLSSMVVDNQGVYQQYLHQVSTALGSCSNNKTSTTTTTSTPTIVRRQTPLVNAGYAARVLAVSSTIRDFLSYHQQQHVVAAKSVPTKRRQRQGEKTGQDNNNSNNGSNNGSNNNNNNNNKVQIVILGCGVDVIGLWAHSLVTDPILLVTIIEYDTTDVCAIKKEILTSQHLVVDNNDVQQDDDRSSSSKSATYHRPGNDGQVDLGNNKNETTNKLSSTIFSGTIVPPVPLHGEQDGCTAPSSSTIPPVRTAKNSSSSSTTNYVLVSADLRDTQSLDTSMEELRAMNLFSMDAPTLVISELVLAYIPPTRTDRLLSWCSNTLCHAPGSALVALEPFGYDDECIDTHIVPVVDGYRRNYCEQFQAKMVRGMSNLKSPAGTNKNDATIPVHHQADNDDDGDGYNAATNFYPIGTSHKLVSNRLQKAGFTRTSTTSLGKAAVIAASSTPSKTFIGPEIFDEHAALVLHLQSYVVAFGVTIIDRDDHRHHHHHRLCQYLFPWERPDACIMARASLPIIDTVMGITYTEIECNDEIDVRRLFECTYKHHMEEYPPIRRLVKGVLQKELRPTRCHHGDDDVVQFGHQDDRTNSSHHVGAVTPPLSSCSSSVIGNFYRSMGGIFLVALRYYDCDGDNKVDDELPDSSDDPITCKVVGCVGVRREEKNGSDDHIGLEIFRLAVDESCRGMGIGKGLLQAVERYAKARENRPKLVASTLTILDAACKLYESLGYTVEKETPLGGTKLVIRSYVKYLLVE